MSNREHDLLGIASDDESDNAGYDSDNKTKGRATKRRRTADNADPFGLGSSDSEPDLDSEEESRPKPKSKKATKTKSSTEEQPNTDEEAQEEELGSLPDLDISDDEAYLESKPSKILTAKPLKAPKKQKKLGVIYLSSLPPYMKPMTLKKKIEDYGFGPVSKVFLAPLITSKAAQKAKSNKRKLFGEGWIEMPKKQAKICAETMNANIVGGKKVC